MYVCMYVGLSFYVYICINVGVSLLGRVWEKIGESIQLVVSSQSGLKSRIASWAKGVGFKGNYTKQSG